MAFVFRIHDALIVLARRDERAEIVERCGAGQCLSFGRRPQKVG